MFRSPVDREEEAQRSTNDRSPYETKHRSGPALISVQRSLVLLMRRFCGVLRRSDSDRATRTFIQDQT